MQSRVGVARSFHFAAGNEKPAILQRGGIGEILFQVFQGVMFPADEDLSSVAALIKSNVLK